MLFRYEHVAKAGFNSDDFGALLSRKVSLAYVARRAFHHLVRHMRETPTEYIAGCFVVSADRKNIEFMSLECSVDEEKARAQRWCVDVEARNDRRSIDCSEGAQKATKDERNAVVPEAMSSCRQKKAEKTYESEVKRRSPSVENIIWEETQVHVAHGYLKLVQWDDERQVAMAGLMVKQLTQPSFAKLVAHAATW